MFDKLDYSMKMTQEQRPILTQNMQQSIKLLQMSLHDLREYIDNEYEKEYMASRCIDCCLDAEQLLRCQVYFNGWQRR